MNFETLVNKFIGVLGLLPRLIVILSLIVFLYGLANYIFNLKDESDRKKAISYIAYGLLGLFIMTSMWGIIYIFTEYFGWGSSIPQLTF